MSEPVRWGILGTARIATKVAAAIHRNPSSELAAIGSRDGARAQQWADEHKAARAYDSYEAVLDDPEIDAVYIPLPPLLHHEWTLKAAEKGKHVLSEKPLAATVADAEEMVAACAQHGVQLMDGVMWLHHPRANDMHALLNEAQLGPFRRLVAAFSFCWETVPEQDLRLNRTLGGGSLLDLGWYCAGAALWATNKMPVRVSGHADWYKDTETDLSFSALMWYDNNRTAAFDCAFDTAQRRWMEVSGTQASLVCDDFTRPWDESKVRCWIHNADAGSVEHTSETPNQETCMIASFSRIVQSGTTDSHWPTISLQTQKMCAALDKSARTGRVVELDD